MANLADEAPVSPVITDQPKLADSTEPPGQAPAELDGTPSSPEKLRRLSRPLTLEGLSPEEREKRLRMHDERKGDPAVLVDLPSTPQAEELEISGAIKGPEKGAQQ